MSKHSNYVSIVMLAILSFITMSKSQIPPKSNANDGDYNTLHRDGSYEFGYATFQID